MKNRNKSSYYPEIKTFKEGPFFPYKELKTIKNSNDKLNFTYTTLVRRESCFLFLIGYNRNNPYKH